MVRLLSTIAVVSLATGCAGEITTIDFGDTEQISQERFAEEIYPILILEETGASDSGGTFTRNCADPGCHGRETNPFGRLPILPEVNQTNALETFRTAISNGYLILGDADNSSFLQRHRDGESPTCFPNRTDCCFMKIEAWINAAEPPNCNCPQEEPD